MFDVAGFCIFYYMELVLYHFKFSLNEQQKYATKGQPNIEQSLFSLKPLNNPKL